VCGGGEAGGVFGECVSDGHGSWESEVHEGEWCGAGGCEVVRVSCGLDGEWDDGGWVCLLAVGREGGERDEAGPGGGEDGGGRDGGLRGVGGGVGGLVEGGCVEADGGVGVVEFCVVGGEDGAVVEEEGGAGAVGLGVGE